MQRFDHRPGGDLVWCRTCGQQFTRTQYRVHGHNPNQSQCGDAQCSRAAVGYVMGADLAHYNNRGAALLCGPHLLERRRKGSEIYIVDGSRCRQCGGTGEVQTRAESVGSASVRWLRCPHCQGSGYDPDPPRQAPASPPQRRAPPRVGPTVDEALRDAERQLREQPPIQEERERREPARQAPPPNQGEQPPGATPPHPDEQREPEQQPTPPSQGEQPPGETPPHPDEQRESEQQAPPPSQAEQPRRETRPPPSQHRAPSPQAAPPPRELLDPERRSTNVARASQKPPRTQRRRASGGGGIGRVVVWTLLITLAGVAAWVVADGRLWNGGGETPAAPVVSVTVLTPVPAGFASEVIPVATGGYCPDREALVALYNATDGANWLRNEGWLSEAPIGEWFGVITDDDCCVIRLDLRGNQLTGEIPPDLGELVNLTTLRLWVNQLSGEIPPELGRLISLQKLELASNQLTGEIPPELGELASLQSLELFSNQLSGEIPPDLGNLTSLTRLNLHSNQLTGEIPPELGELANLQSLALFHNQLSGEIPPDFGKLASLQGLTLNRNQLSGEIPPELGKLASLQLLSINRNQLSGEIPRELGRLAKLTVLVIEGNQLSGCVPDGLRGQLALDLSNLGGLPFCNE